MSKLVTILRQLTGRQLTDEEIDLAKRNVKAKSGHERKMYSVKDDEIVIETTLLKFATTPDASEGMSCPHDGFYSHYQSVERYTLDGLLKEKSIIDGHGRVFLNAGVDTTYKEIVYNPPGRFIGKNKK